MYENILLKCILSMLHTFFTRRICENVKISINSCIEWVFLNILCFWGIDFLLMCSQRDNLRETTRHIKNKNIRPGMLAFQGRYFFVLTRRLSRPTWSEAESRCCLALHRNVECLFYYWNGVNIGFMGFPGDLLLNNYAVAVVT